ncbi:hypothetical protein C84B14_12483 [Salinisphaera sp. C84B14]
MEASIREQVHARESQEAFIARGLAAREEAQRTGEYFTVDEVLDGLDAIAEENARAGDT